MADKKDEKEQKSPALEIARLVLDPDPEKLPGFTRIPLDQVRPCSFAAVFAKELVELCQLSKRSQDMYAANWKLWHSEQTEIPGLGKRIPPLNGENRNGNKFFPDGKPQQPPGKRDARFKVPKITASIILDWLNQYYMLRRSTTPDFTMCAFELAARDIESKPIEETNEWEKVIHQ